MSGTEFGNSICKGDHDWYLVYREKVILPNSKCFGNSSILLMQCDQVCSGTVYLVIGSAE